MTPHPRWLATVTYRSEHGAIDVDYAFEELEELHDLIERGPSFYAIAQILIVLNAAARCAATTIEHAERT